VQPEAFCSGLKTTKIVFGWGSTAPDPAGGAHDAPQAL